jgi:hypothetical protein
MGWSPERCSEELRHWTEIIEQPDYAVRIWRDILPDFGDRLLGQSLQEHGQRVELQAEVEALRLQVEAYKAAHEHEAKLPTAVESSTSWRMTAPLQRTLDRVRRFTR